MFTMLYGLPTPWEHAAHVVDHQPALLRRLHDLGYHTSLYVGTDLDVINRFALGFDEVHRHFQRNGMVDLDEAAAGSLLAARNARDENPRFDLLFLASTHFYYWCDPASRRHLPDDMGNLATFNSRDPAVLANYRNRYRNSVIFTDALAGSILAKTNLDRTIVLVSSDHGESFEENGQFNHGNERLVEAETHVPLLLRVPGHRPGAVSRMTSHVDIVPTLMALLGVTNPPEDFSSGTSLLDETGTDRVTACTDTACAVVDSRGGFTQFAVSRGHAESIDPRARLFLP
jgi:membrane-anchored protein YejM (alkaline phosphatase superfamily)